MHRLFLSFLLATSLICYAEEQKAITFGWGGRLGDNLMDYAHAKWISYRWGIPLLFKEFEYSDQFVFDNVETKLNPQSEAPYKKVTLTTLSQLDESVTENTLYFHPHVCDSYEEYVFNGSYGTFIPVDWTDETFRTMMRKLIAPKHPLETFTPPQGIISVALHYRTGGGYVYDTDTMKRGLPLRFPADDYYFEQLAALYTMVGCQPMHVHIFTDHPHPKEVADIFRAQFPQTNIDFNFRREGNRHNAYVLEDLFSMMHFDCLIRPMSHYSMTASHLGDFKIEIFPTHGTWLKNKFIVDKVVVLQNASWDPTNRQWSPVE